MHTPGHTYDHLCLYDPEFGVVLTGDHVLPSITPHISGLAPEPDPLALFFASLTRMAEMTDISVALPGPRSSVPGPPRPGRGRSSSITRNASTSSVDALPELPNGTVDAFMRVLFRERSWGEMAESETYAHLEHLRERGELERHFEGGMAHYTLVG